MSFSKHGLMQDTDNIDGATCYLVVDYMRNNG